MLQLLCILNWNIVNRIDDRMLQCSVPSCNSGHQSGRETLKWLNFVIVKVSAVQNNGEMVALVAKFDINGLTTWVRKKMMDGSECTFTSKTKAFTKRLCQIIDLFLFLI